MTHGIATATGMVVAGIGAALAASVLKSIAISRLRRLHAGLWRQLGEPPAAGFFDSSGSLRGILYVIGPGRRERDDPVLAGYCRLASACYLLLMVIVALLAVGGLTGLF